jgi:PAS domain S-box-containing protein
LEKRKERVDMGTPPPHVQQSGTALEEFFDLSIDLLCIVGFDGYFKRVNASLERTLGYPEPELFSRSVFDITHPDDVEPSREALGRLAEGHDLVGFESRVICADGSVRWLEWNTRTMPERGLVYGVARDTTERRRAGAELREAQLMLEASRDQLRVLADEQAALRRVATLVARETSPEAVFAAVVREVGEVLGVDATHLGRYDDDGTVVSVAQWGSYPSVPIGARFPLEGDSVSARVLRTGRPARMDDYMEAPGVIAATIRQIGIRFSLGVPISVGGRTWGVMTATSKDPEPFPEETELRLQDFTELVATAISNATAHDRVRVLADEQAALRRVATLVARGAHPGAVFDAVTQEVVELLKASAVSLARHEGDVLTVIATSGTAADVRIGDRFPVGGANVTSAVLRTGRTARLDDLGDATGPIGDTARRAGVRSAVAAPVVVDGRTWGVLAAIWTDRGPAPDDTEERLAGFAELLDTAIANADGRDQLAASRARVLAAGDEARRRVVRDLHDGAQQRLVHTIVTLKLAQQALSENPSDAAVLVAEARSAAELATAELRELARGILPSVLTRGGLRAGVDAFVSRLDLSVDLDVSSEPLPPDIEASAYFIVAEALTNVVKHAHATRATVRAAIDDGVLALEVRDDGVGGADPDGHGLVGIADRVAALSGRLRIESAGRSGTVVAARLPLSTR